MLRYSILAGMLAVLLSHTAMAQELFVYSEPASNMPAKSIGIRATNWLMDAPATARINYHLVPELMWGVNKQLMLHAEGYFSNRSGALAAEGGALYAKYRFYSHDHVYRHFRMAAFGRAALNNAAIHQEEIDINGHNTGYQLGLIATQLLHKTALSATVYYQHASDNAAGHELPGTQSASAVNYILSGGRLILPKRYAGYKQTNVNLMAELLGETLAGNGLHYLDIAPSIQLIFNSQTRIDIGYRQQLYSNMQRTAPNGLLLRVEYLLYNVL